MNGEYNSEQENRDRERIISELGKEILLIIQDMLKEDCDIWDHEIYDRIEKAGKYKNINLGYWFGQAMTDLISKGALVTTYKINQTGLQNLDRQH